MFSAYELFANPERLGEVKSSVEILEEQIKTVEGLEHAKERLHTCRPLTSNTLNKCKVFVEYVNQAKPHSSFLLEVSQLSLNELLFSSISFEERRLKALLRSFRASDIRDYVRTQKISCVNRSEISNRLRKVLIDSKNGNFDQIYQSLTSGNTPESVIHDSGNRVPTLERSFPNPET